MAGIFERLFSTDGYMPHGHCYLWQPGLVFTHSISDLLIGLSYLGITLLLYRIVRSTRIPFSGMILAFGAFIGFCGATHFLEVLNLWQPYYWVAGLTKVVTAIASVATALFLIPVRPKISELANAARLSEERRERLEVAHKELEHLFSRLKENDELRARFFANVSHELRTPLALILGPTERLLGQSSLDESQKSQLRVIERNARSLLKQVNELLDVAKMEAGKMAAAYIAVDLNHMLRTTTSHFEDWTRQHQIELKLELGDAPLWAEIDADKIERVLFNLLANALKFTPSGGRVSCRAMKSSEGEVLIEVEDSGAGIPASERERIFERFQQGESQVGRSGSGTGLGLAIAKEFVTLHRGRIWVESGNEGGACFSVLLPARAPEGVVHVRNAFDAEWKESNPIVAEAALASLPPRPIGSEAQDAVSLALAAAPRVVVAEDNPELRAFLTETLAREFQVSAAADGREALEQALALQPDLVITDIMMPRMTGDRLCREMRQRESLKDVPVLILTARADEQLSRELLSFGAQDYVMKPFSTEELLARARLQTKLKRTHDVLKKELAVKSGSLDDLTTELAQRKHELELSLETARVARQAAEQASEVKSHFLSLVSHELNTPLTTLFLTLQLMKKRGQIHANQEGAFERLLNSAQRLKDLIDSLLEYTRIESGREILQHEEVDFEGIVQSVRDELEPQAQHKNLRLKTRPPQDPLLAKSDARCLRIVLSNLVGNAVKYTERGSIEISWQKMGERWAFSVSDTGPGIDPADQSRIFEPFEQLEPLRRKAVPGVGLGLALVQQLVRALGGAVELRSTKGEGSTFTVLLPLNPAPKAWINTAPSASSAAFLKLR